MLKPIGERIRFLGAVLVDNPAALLRDLLQFGTDATLGGDDLDVVVANLVSAVRAAVPSYRGMSLTISHSDQPVTLVNLSDDHGSILTSLRLPFASLGNGSRGSGRIVFWAARPGAFVDLAADLGYTLKTPVITHPRASTPMNARNHDGSGPAGDDRGPEHDGGQVSIVLDADIPPDSLLPGISGLDQLSTINRAIGVLIDHGYDPDEALRVLHRDAVAAGVEPHVYAARLLKR